MSYNLTTTTSVSRFQEECCESAFEALFNRCFINALKNNIPLSPEIAKECVDYSKKVLRNAGGISLITNALECAKTPAKKDFLLRFNNACVEAGMEMSLSFILDDAVKSAIEDAEEDDMDNIVDEEDDGEYDDFDDIDDEDEEIDEEPKQPEMPSVFKGKDVSQIQLDTKISDKELNQLKTAANKVDLDNISNIVSDKVANVLQAEKVQRFKINEEKERIKQAIIADPSNAIEDDNAAESAMDRLLAVPLGKLDISVYTTLFSTIQRRAIESILVYERGNTPVSDILSELTVNNTFDIFHPEKKSFYDATLKAIEMTAVTECTDDCHMEKVINNATIFATIVYTMLELLHTMNLRSCTPTDVKCLLTKNADCVTPSNDVATTINKNATAAIECDKKKIYGLKDCESLENEISDIKVLKGRLVQAKESAGLKIDDSIMPKLDELISIAENRRDSIMAEFTSGCESANNTIDRLTRIKQADVSSMNSIARALKHKNFDNVKFKCCECAESTAMFRVSAEIGKTPVYTTELVVSGMESTSPDKYINYLLKKSNMKDIVHGEEKPDYCVIFEGKTMVVGE